MQNQLNYKTSELHQITLDFTKLKLKWIVILSTSSCGINLCLSYIINLSLTDPCSVRSTSFCNPWLETEAIY